MEGWLDYCKEHPPLQMMVQAYMGIKNEEPLRLTDDNFEQFKNMISMGGQLNG